MSPKSSINTIFIKSLAILNIQEQILLTSFAEDFTNPTTRNQPQKLTKEKGIQDIMNNTTMDTFNNWVYVKYLYKPNLPDLGENYYSTTKRTHTLNVMISSQPAIATKINKYIQQQIEKWELRWDGPSRLQEGTLTPLCSLQLHGIQHQYFHQGEDDRP